MKKYQIAVIGSAGPEEYQYRKPLQAMYGAAESIGRELAKNNCITVCGGKGGVMLAVARGAREAKGITVAETSGIERLTSNEYIDIEIVTGDLAFRGPSQLIGMSDAVIVLGGGAGTLQELCVAYRLIKPVVLLMGYGGWTDRISKLEWLDERRSEKFICVSTPQSAVQQVLSILRVRKEALK